MAISIDFNFKGVSIDSGYLKIWRFEGDKNKLSFGLGYHSSKGEEMLFSETYTINDYILDSPNPIQQAYNHLKELEKFKLSEDC